MYPKASEMGQKSAQKICDINDTKTATDEKAKLLPFDEEISSGWSFKRLRRQQIVDQIFHFSVFSCLIILACYIIAVHTLLCYETQDTANLRNEVEYAFTLNEHLENVVKLLRFRLDRVEKNLADLKTQIKMNQSNCQDHHRPRRSTPSFNTTTSQPRKKLRRDRTKNIETVATQFRTSSHSEYERNPMQGELGPWFVGSEFNRNMAEFGATLRFYDRKIEISRAGLYFIYSQVTYDNQGILNSYSINVISRNNDTGETTNESVAQCNAVGPYNNPAEISCYTSTIRILHPKDIVYLQQNSANRTIFWERDMTFWGIILLSEP